MNCDIQNVFKNPRYRILDIKGEQFILDMWGSFWKIVFPFFFWLLPNTVFKVQDPTIAKKLREHEVKQPKKVGTAITLLSGGIAVFLGNLLTPLIDNLNVQSAKFINLSIIAITIIIVFLLFFYMNRTCKKRLYQIINTKQLSTSLLWIRPKSFKQFFQVSLYYLLFLSFTLLGFATFFELTNVIILLVTAACFFLVLISSLLTVIGGRTTVKFKR